MKLHEIDNRGSDDPPVRIQVRVRRGSFGKWHDAVALFRRIDGAYANCQIEGTTDLAYLHYDTELEQDGDGYRVIK